MMVRAAYISSPSAALTCNASVILPNPGASEECDVARVAVEEAETALDEILDNYKEQLR
jgi:hypothetical protein